MSTRDTGHFYGFLICLMFFIITVIPVQGLAFGVITIGDDPIAQAALFFCLLSIMGLSGFGMCYCSKQLRKEK